MRSHGVRSLDMMRTACRHETVLNVDHWPDHVTVPFFGARLVCTRCGVTAADSGPNWREYWPRRTR